MSESVTKIHYDRKSGYGISKNRLKNITSLAGDVAGKTVLDIGCGNGFLGEHFKSLGAEKVDGCDLSHEAISKAEKVLNFAVECDVETQSLQDVLNGNKYDIVVATELIEHLFTPEDFLENVRSILKPDGVLILTTPNFLVWTNRIKMLFGEFEYTDTGFLDRGHIHFFTYSSLKKVLYKKGYLIEGEENIYHPKVPMFIAKCLPKLSVFQMVFKCKSKI